MGYTVSENDSVWRITRGNFHAVLCKSKAYGRNSTSNLYNFKMRFIARLHQIHIERTSTSSKPSTKLWHFIVQEKKKARKRLFQSLFEAI